MATFRPLHDRLVIRREQENGVSAGGIIIPDRAKEKPCKGVVIAVGKGNTLPDGTVVPMSMKEGDMVMFPSLCGVEIKIDEGDCRIMREDDILGILS